MKQIIALLVCLVAYCRSAGAAFEACDGKSPGFGKCFQTSIQAFFHTLGDLKSEGPHEPLWVGEVPLGPGKLFDAKVTLSSIETSGWSKTQFSKVTTDLFKQDIIFKGRTPAFTIKSKYQADGNVLGETLKGEGILTTILENANWNIDYNLEVFEKDEVKYWRRIRTIFTVKPEKVRFQFGNQSESLNARINNNWKDVFAELKPDYENLLNAAFTRLSDSLLAQAPLSTFVANN